MGVQTGVQRNGGAEVPKGLGRDHVAQFHELGYAIVRSVFTPDEVDALAAAIDRIYARALRHEEGTPAAAGRPEVGFRKVEDPHLGRICRIATWPAHFEPLLDRVRVDRRMLALLEPLLGPSLKQITSQLHWKPRQTNGTKQHRQQHRHDDGNRIA